MKVSLWPSKTNWCLTYWIDCTARGHGFWVDQLMFWCRKVVCNSLSWWKYLSDRRSCISFTHLLVNKYRGTLPFGEGFPLDTVVNENIKKGKSLWKTYHHTWETLKPAIKNEPCSVVGNLYQFWWRPDTSLTWVFNSGWIEETLTHRYAAIKEMASINKKKQHQKSLRDLWSKNTNATPWT